MIGVPERIPDVRTGGRPGRTVLFVTNSLPGSDAGFAKSGHAHYLGSIIDHFVQRSFDVVVIVLNPKLDRLALQRREFRVAGPSLWQLGDWVVLREPKAVMSVAAWFVYSRLPARLQGLGSAVRTRLRRARGFVHVLGRFMSDADRRFVASAIAAEQPDVVVYDSIFHSCGRLSDAQYWVLTHEIKHERAESFRQADVAVYPADFSADAERAILGEIGNVIAIQWDDATQFRRMLPEARVVVLPVTMEPVTAQRETSSADRFIFVGSGSFHNVDGIRWFLDACWPEVRRRLPSAVLDVYGTVCYRLGELPAGAVAHGMAPDLSAAYARAAVAIVPLRIGSGLKVKLVEALAHGLPVVTTPVGAQGLSAFEPQPFVVAASPADFAESCVELARFPERAAALSVRARECATRFTPAAAFAEFYAATEAALAIPDTEAHGSELPRICVAIPTFRRSDLLRQLLRGIAAQRIDTLAHVEVAVFDNDAAGSAQPIVDAEAATFPFPLSYRLVPEPGLAMVRNATLDFVRARFDYLAMIDDDEVPDPAWLAELLRIANQTRAEAVVGPVFPLLAPGAPAWLRGLRAEETPLLADGSLVREGWSCNALLRVGAVVASAIRFDPALNMRGGEDQLFFRQLRAQGARIAYAAKATVHEAIPPARWTVRFNLLRSFRRGNSLAYCEQRLHAQPSWIVLRALKALAFVGLGSASFAASVLRRQTVVPAACSVARGVGMLAGLMGSMYAAYERTDAAPRQHPV